MCWVCSIRSSSTTGCASCRFAFLSRAAGRKTTSSQRLHHHGAERSDLVRYFCAARPGFLITIESHMTKTNPALRPGKQGLYDPRFEHDACGLGFVADIRGRESHAILEQALQVLKNLDHRGACGFEANTGDGAGVLLQMPHAFLMEVCKQARLSLPAPGEYACGMVFLPRNPLKRRRLEEHFEHIVQSEG